MKCRCWHNITSGQHNARILGKIWIFSNVVVKIDQWSLIKQSESSKKTRSNQTLKWILQCELIMIDAF